MHRYFFFVAHRSVDGSRGRRGFVLLCGNLHSAARSVDRRKAVDPLLAALQLPDENRPLPGQIRRHRRFKVEPEQRLAIDCEMSGQPAIDEFGQPGPGCDDQRAGRVRLLVRGDRHRVCRSFEPRHALFPVDFRAVPLRHRQLRANACFGPQEPGVAFEIAPLVVGHVETWKSPPDLRRVQHLVRDCEFSCGCERVVEETLDMSARGLRAAGDDEPAARGEELRPRLLLQLAPELVRAQRKRGVLLSFADREPGNARVAVTRPERVRRRELIDAENARAPAGELAQRRASHRSESEHDCVEAFHSRDGITGGESWRW